MIPQAFPRRRAAADGETQTYGFYVVSPSRLCVSVDPGPCYAENFPMSNIEITLPDGSKQSWPGGTPPLEVARSISPRLADAAIVAKVNGELYDLTRPLEKDANLQILTTRDPESLEVYRHSTAHLLAAAVHEL